MFDRTNRRTLCGGAAAALASAWIPALAQDERSLTLITPAPPGGSNDAVARLLAEAWTTTKRPVVVENKAGASGTIGFAAATKAPPDGSVIVLTSSAFTINPVAMKKLPFDVVKDFSGVAGVSRSPVMLVAHSQLPVQSLRDLRALMHSEPSRVTFAAGDNAALLATTQLLMALGTKASIVNYRGTAPAMTDVAGGHVGFSITSIASAMPFIKGGQVRPIGILARTRLKSLPDIPTLAEQGTDVEFLLWIALHTSSHVPRAVVNRLGAEVQKIITSPTFASRLESIYTAPLLLGPAELDAFVASDAKRMVALAAEAGLQPE
jgi:tripartite-type tricarboxylate transporter receptor subunit TctC